MTNIRNNAIEIKLLAITLLFTALSVSVFAQKGKSKNQETLEVAVVEEENTSKSDKKSKAKSKETADLSLISEENVPNEVLKAYKKRYATAVNAVWRYYKDEQRYEINCVYRNIPSEISFNKEGVWIGTTESWSTDKLSNAFVKTINQYFQNYQINSVKMLSANGKDNMFIIGIFEKDNIKKKLETKVYLDKSGNFIRSEDPEEPDESGKDTEKIDKKQEKIDKKLMKDFERDSKSADKPLQLTENELPSTVQRWVTVNYPEYIYKNIVYEEVDEFEDEGDIYQITIQRKGINQPHATVWFTRNGDFLKLEDKFKEEKEVQAETEVKAEPEPEAQKANKKEKEKQVTEKEEPTIVEVDIEDVKAEILEAFKTKYPRAKNTFWAENEDGDWVASFNDQYGQNMATFSDKTTNWMHTKTLVPDINRIPMAVRTYVEKNHPKKQLKQGWSVKTPDTKPYFTVELYTKKTKSYEYIDLWANGKIKE